MPVYSFQLSAFLAGKPVTVRDADGDVAASGTLDGDARFSAELAVGDYVASATDGRYTYRSAGTVEQGDPDRLAGVDLSDVLTVTEANSTFLQQASGDLGPELVTNGTFATDLTGWAGAGWSWVSGAAKHATGSEAALTQAALTATVGATYEVTYTVSGSTAGETYVYFGGAYLVPTPNGNGTHTRYVTATATDAFRVVPTTTFDGSVDSVSVKVLDSADVRIDNAAEFVKPVTVHAGIDVPTGLPISIGQDALRATAGLGTYSVPSANVAIGYRAGYNNTTGHVTAVGYKAGEANTDGVLTAFGKWAGQANTTGHTTVYGNAAGMRNTTGNIDVFGDEAGADNTTGTIAVFGYYAGHTNVTGTVTAFGHQAADTCTTDAICTVVGHKAGRFAGQGSTIIGYEAGSVASGRATAIGHESLRNATTAPATALGYRAGYYCTTSDSTFLGYQAGYGVTSGQVIAIGSSAALDVTTGSVIAIGKRAGYGTTLANVPKTDTYGILIGDLTNRTVPSATALIEYLGIGHAALIGAHGAVAVGAYANASHADSVALGRSSTTTAANQVMVGDRDIESTRTGGGIVLKSPDGTRYKLTVANGGTVSVVAA